MSAVLTRHEHLLLEILRSALTGEAVSNEGISADDWRQICMIAERHAVLPLLLPAAEGQACEDVCMRASERCTLQFYRLLTLTCRCIRILREAGIDAVVLKGPGAAWYYQVPEHRQSGDIDLLLTCPEQLAEACSVLASDGAVPEAEQHANHHRCMRTPEGITVELHTSLVEDFDEARTNALVAGIRMQIAEHAVRREILPGAVLPVPDEPEQAISLMAHMLQHFLRAGFGLKLLCDWTVFWNRQPEGADMSRYERFLDESGLRGFADMLGSVCIRYLGLRQDRIRRAEDFDERYCREFIREVFDSEAFGHTSEQRMVMVRGGTAGFVREFHHQMHLNFPEAGRWVPLWPALWGATLARFLRNNRVLRKTSVAAILKETRRRSRITDPMHLFER